MTSGRVPSTLRTDKDRFFITALPRSHDAGEPSTLTEAIHPTTGSHIARCVPDHWSDLESVDLWRFPRNAGHSEESLCEMDSPQIVEFLSHLAESRVERRRSLRSLYRREDVLTSYQTAEQHRPVDWTPVPRTKRSESQRAPDTEINRQRHRVRARSRAEGGSLSPPDSMMVLTTCILSSGIYEDSRRFH